MKMMMSRLVATAIFLSVAFATVCAQAAGSAEIRIQADRPAVSLSPHLYGLFFEDINYGADGGLYAELVQNRSFEYHQAPRNDLHVPLYAWEKVERDGARIEAAVVNTRPLNTNNTHYLNIKIAQPGVAGMANTGFDGIPLDAGAKYDFSLFVRLTDWSGDSAITVTLEGEDGSTCGSLVLKGAGALWNKLEGTITCGKKMNSARLLVTTKGSGTLDLDMVSLFPQDTFKGRKNGLRKDLVLALKDLNPKFLRFPGGCASHGNAITNMYRWKDSIGPVEQRKPNWSIWSYHQTYGLGYFEYFQLCEDLGMEALPVVPVGVTCGFAKYECVPMNELQPHIQDVVDLIEFANGPDTSKWGAERAKMGHPKPFNIKFISLGNEEHDTPELRERFPLFVEAVRKAYPDIKIIGTSGLGTTPPLYGLMGDLKVYSSDEHYYEPPAWFLRNQNRFDNFDRSKPKVFVGEYAAHDVGRQNTLFAALSEAAYLTGVERNGDIVDMTCYAPLLARQGHTQWTPDLIYFDKRRVLRSANYYVQQLFAQNKGDVYLPNTTAVKSDWKPATISGCVGVGTWNTAIEVAEVTVNGRKLDPAKWKSTQGNFQMREGNYVQSDATAAPAISFGDEVFSGDTVTYTVRARKTGGAEGFLVRFGAKDGKDGYWWNVGGWGNSRHAIEEFFGEAKTAVTEVPGSIKDGQWYDLKVVLTPGRIQCFLDGQPIHDYKIRPAAISVASALDRGTGEVIIKLVNPSPEPVAARISLPGVKQVAAQARLITLSGAKEAVNTFEDPDTVKPVTSEIAVASEFNHTIPAMAVQFIRVTAN